MPHIAMVIPSLAGGGAERTALRVAGGLAARGHRVDIVLFSPHVAYPGEVPAAARLIVLSGRRAWARRDPSAMPADTKWRPERASLLQGAGLAAGLVRDFPAAAHMLLRRAALGRALRLARYAARERPDILFANLPQAEHAAFYAARLAGPCAFPPVVPVIHNVVTPDARHTQRRRLLFPSAAHVVAVSQGVAETVAGAAGVPEARLSVIYNPAAAPAAPRRAEEPADHPWFADGGPPVILGAGRLARQKDFTTLIEAFRRVVAERPCRLLILGEGPMRAELEGRVRALGLEAHAALPGWVENPYAYMARAALFVLSSRHEGLGNVLVEALACGCPAVSTDCPAGPAEILEDTRLLAPVGDPEALAGVMLRALAHPAEKSRLRAKAMRFSVDRALDEYETLIAAIFGEHGKDGQA